MCLDKLSFWHRSLLLLFMNLSVAVLLKSYQTRADSRKKVQLFQKYFTFLVFPHNPFIFNLIRKVLKFWIVYLEIYIINTFCGLKVYPSIKWKVKILYHHSVCIGHSLVLYSLFYDESNCTFGLSEAPSNYNYSFTININRRQESKAWNTKLIRNWSIKSWSAPYSNKTSCFQSVTEVYIELHLIHCNVLRIQKTVSDKKKFETKDL